MYRLAVAAYQNGEFASAISHLERLLENEPAHAEGQHLLAVLLAQEKRFDEAELHFRSAIRNAPNRLDFHCNYALSLHEEGRDQEAVDKFRFVLSRQASLVLALNGVGNALCALGEHKQAEDAFRKALKVEPNSPLLHNNLGNAAKQQGQIKQSIASYRRALAIDSNHSESCVNLGIALKETGRVDEARELFEKALSLKPGLKQAANQLWQVESFWREPIVGRHLSLRPYNQDDATFIHRCFSDAPFMMNYHRFLSRRESLTTIAAHLKEAEKTLPWQSCAVDWVICRHHEKQRRVGLANLVDLSVVHRRAEFLVGIPAREDRQVGAGLEASLLAMDFAFNLARLNKLTILVYEGNDRAQKGALALGFKQEGFRQDHLYDDATQKYFGIHENGLLEVDFRANKRLSSLSQRILGRDVTGVTAAKRKIGF